MQENKDTERQNQRRCAGSEHHKSTTCVEDTLELLELPTALATAFMNYRSDPQISKVRHQQKSTKQLCNATQVLF